MPKSCKGSCRKSLNPLRAAGPSQVAHLHKLRPHVVKCAFHFYLNDFRRLTSFPSVFQRAGREFHFFFGFVSFNSFLLLFVFLLLRFLFFAFVLFRTLHHLVNSNIFTVHSQTLIDRQKIEDSHTNNLG